MLDRVDHRLTHGDADPVDAVFVEAGHLADVIAGDLHEIQHLEIAVDLNPDRAAAGHHAEMAPLATERRSAQPG